MHCIICFWFFELDSYIPLNCFFFFFSQALKEAFEVFCNKGVAGNSSAELLATFCDNILKKGGSEKLSDEAIEETLEKVVQFPVLLLFNISQCFCLWDVFSCCLLAIFIF